MFYAQLTSTVGLGRRLTPKIRMFCVVIKKAFIFQPFMYSDFVEFQVRHQN